MGVQVPSPAPKLLIIPPAPSDNEELGINFPATTGMKIYATTTACRCGVILSNTTAALFNNTQNSRLLLMLFKYKEEEKKKLFCMIKKLSVLLAAVISLFVGSSVFAQEKKVAFKKPLRILFNRKNIKLKETLEYSVKWLGMDVGKIKLRLEGFKNIRGHKCYHIIAEAIPNEFLNGMWNTDYKLHSYIDYRTLSPLRFEKRARINKEFNHALIEFDQKKQEARYFCEEVKLATTDTPASRKIKLKPIIDKISTGTQDLLSIFYYFRFRELQENFRYNINIYYDQKNWPVEIKTERASLKRVGERRELSVIKISSSSKLNEHLFGGEESVFFLTFDDSRHIPLEFKFDTTLGSVTGIIQEIPQ